LAARFTNAARYTDAATRAARYANAAGATGYTNAAGAAGYARGPTGAGTIDYRAGNRRAGGALAIAE
jgi:hypothetical protein